MRKRWKKLAFIAGGLVSLGTLITTPAQAQFPGSLAAGPGHGASGMGDPTTASGPVTLPNDGSPNAFNEWDPANTWHQPVLWFGAEAVIGITRRAPLNTPLVTTSSNPNPATDVGALGEPNTQVIAGLGGLDLRNPAGVRVGFGVSPTADWLVPLEVIYTYMHERNISLAANSDVNGNPLLARPILATEPGQPSTETVYLTSFPNFATGGINVQSSLLFWGLQVQAVVKAPALEWGNDADGLAISFPLGFRYVDLEDTVTVTSSTTSINPAFVLPFFTQNQGIGNRVLITDSFKGSNEFRGAEFGTRFDFRFSPFSIIFEPRVNIGSTSQNVIIGGVSVLDPAGGGAPISTPGGILALPSNGGSHEHERFTVLPEGDLTLAWQLFPWFRIQAGYNLIYWSNVVRAGDQINRAVDVRQVPTDSTFAPSGTFTNPTFSANTSSFTMQTITFGFVFSF